MKKLTLAVVLSSFYVFAADNEVRVGDQTAGDGTKVSARAGHEGQTIVGELSGRYGEAARLGQTYVVATAPTPGYTVVAASVSPLVAATTSLLLGLYNPPTSGRNLEVTHVVAHWISGTPGVGGLVYNLACGQQISVGQNAPPVNLLTGSASGSVGKGFTGTITLAGQSVLTYLRPVANCVPFAAAIAATSVGLNCYEPVEGAIIVGPGCILALAPATVGTSPILTAAIQYREARP